MSRRQPQPSLRCAVREAPSDCPEFQALCDALQRNDPTVTTVTTDRSTTPDEYGRRLGEALLSNNNSVVSEIDLSLSYLLCESDRRGRTTTGATPLVTWMEHSSSLRTVTIRAMSYSDNRYHALSPRLQQRVLDAVRKNPHIRGFRSYLYDFPLQLLTDYISTPNNAVKLQSLKMYYIPSYRLNEMDQRAQVIAGLSGLKELSLTSTIAFLKLLPAHSTSLLRELEIHFDGSVQASDMAIFYSVLSCSKDLQRVVIKWLKIYSDTWDLLRNGLQSNPSITQLKLESCSIAPDASSIFLNHFQSNDMASHQNLRSLELSSAETLSLSTSRHGVYNTPRLVSMLCGSVLQHVAFNFANMPEDMVADFLTALSRNSSTVRLRSMHLKGRFLWDMTAYLSSTVHLRHFTFTYLRFGEISLPSTFLSSLRRNGSLHTVEFKNEEGRSYFPSDYAARMIQACMTRNRELPTLMTKSFDDEASTESTESGNNCGHDAVSATRKKSFPALCQVSQQTERMAPNSMLQGLLASSDMLNAMSSSCVLGKRVAASALEDV